MCGITGIWDFKDKISPQILEKMTDALNHRGPDDSGIFIDVKNNIGFGHRRLSIIDLSPAGHQPMPNADETVWVTFNGEIYNFKEIREELEKSGRRFKSGSDTEVIITAYEEWGMESIKRYRGMFAFAIWDKRKEKLFLVRDRAGVKPLYYYIKNGLLLFASELKSFHQHHKFDKEINFDTLASFLQFGYILAPNTIFNNTYKIRPGHYIEIDKNGQSKETKYWDIIDSYLSTPINKPEDEIENELEQILKESFQYRMVSDVPVGVFLSGGVDSSLVTAILQAGSKVPIKTFTIGFHEKDYNEAPHAKKIAEFLKTDHNELYCTPKDALEIIPKLPDIYDEPFGDSSGVPTYLVSKFASHQVKVALSADAGDELFCGYSRYGLLNDYYKTIRMIPSFLMPAMSTGLSMFSSDFIGGVYHNFSSVLPKYTNIKDKIYKFQNVLKYKNKELSGIVRNSYSYWLESQVKKMLVMPYSQVESGFSDFGRISKLDVLSQMQAIDYKTYLTDDIFTKVDRATMAVGLESREPLVDHKIAEYIARVPADFKYRKGVSKYILKKILYKYIPKELIDRPKQGFGIPMDAWLKNDLKNMLQGYLSAESIKKQGIFNGAYLSDNLSQYLSGKSESAHKFWFLLMFQMWYEKWMK